MACAYVLKRVEVVEVDGVLSLALAVASDGKDDALIVVRDHWGIADSHTALVDTIDRGSVI